MRILLAVDGSVCSDRATALVAALPLPPDSAIRVVAVLQPFADALALSYAAAGDASANLESEEERDARHLREAIGRSETALRRDGVTVDGFLVRGRPASSIVDEALGMGADLVVVGSRGHGTIATMVLGSTAAEVVDHAPCPVLVARGTEIGRVAFADDGSSQARRAEALLTTWPMFVGAQIDVLNVAEVAVPVAAGFTPGLYEQVLESYTRSVGAARDASEAEVRTAAHRLADAGLLAEAVPLEGDPAGEIIRYAEAHKIGTIVMGTRGHTGLARLFLGSVARNVLIHAHCSVLVVRATA
ncbi:MAG TPA: universal stress protein [Candidatus Limnocylindrales bacterium]